MENTKEGDNTEDTSPYIIVDVSGIKCIEWTFPDLPEDKLAVDRERSRRRKIKDSIGSKNIETPMLDSRLGKQGKEHCDIIIITHNLELWEKTLCDFYVDAGYKHEVKPLGTAGHQLSLYDEETLFVTINFYPNTNKFMIQPGNKNPQKLAEWLAHFGQIRDIVAMVNEDGSKEDEETYPKELATEETGIQCEDNDHTSQAMVASPVNEYRTENGFVGQSIDETDPSVDGTEPQINEDVDHTQCQVNQTAERREERGQETFPNTNNTMNPSNEGHDDYEIAGGPCNDVRDYTYVKRPTSDEITMKQQETVGSATYTPQYMQPPSIGLPPMSTWNAHIPNQFGIGSTPARVMVPGNYGQYGEQNRRFMEPMIPRFAQATHTLHPPRTHLSPSPQQPYVPSSWGQFGMPDQGEKRNGSCDECHGLRNELISVRDKITSFCDLVQTLTIKLEESTMEHRRQVDVLISENIRWREQVTDLAKQGSCQSPQHLLIGDETIREVNKDKLVNTVVICKPGGTINDPYHGTKRENNVCSRTKEHTLGGFILPRFMSGYVGFISFPNAIAV